MSRLKKHSEQFMEKFISFISYLSTGKVNGMGPQTINTMTAVVPPLHIGVA